MDGLNLELGLEANLLLGALSGIIGAIVITVLIYLLRIAGTEVDLPYLMGSFFVDISNKTKVYVVGIALHIIIGGIWGLIYVGTQAGIGINPGWATGLLWGFTHGIFVGVLMGTIGESHPHIGENKTISDPGILGSRWSALMPYLIIGLHVIFGVITMLTYQLLFNP